MNPARNRAEKFARGPRVWAVMPPDGLTVMPPPGFRRLDKLTALLAKACDAWRAADPKDRARRERIGRVQQKLRAARGREIARLHANGVPFQVIGAHLDATDPYRHGVPDNRPVRQDWGR